MTKILEGNVRPGVTVLMPVRNGARYLENSMSNILENCSKADEIIIVEDNSSDDSMQQLKEWAKRDSRIRVVKNRKAGIVSALNLGLQLSSNNWIARFDVDDQYPRNRIDLQMGYLQEGCVAVFSDYDLRGEGTTPLGRIVGAINSDAVSLSLVSGQRTPHPSVIYRKDSVISVGGYREEDFPAEDLSLWLRLSRSGKLISAPRVLLDYRINQHSVTMQNQNSSKRKRIELMQSIGIHSPDVTSTCNNWREYINDSKNHDDSMCRSILLLRDLMLIHEITGLKAFKGGLRVPILETKLFKVDLLNELVKLNKERKMRHRYRMRLD